MPMTMRLCGRMTVAALLGATVFGQAPPQSVDAIFKDFATDQSPGCAVGATRGDAPLTAKAYGMADLEHGVPLTPQSVFYMASVSKQFTALSILLLERDGKLHLEDRVRTHVPELPDYAAAITIRQLLHHTSGLRDYLTLSSLAGNPPDYVITERAVLNMLARQRRLNFEPGAEHLYSNSGYVLLSIIVHRVAGRPLDEFARERIFTPLNMRSTRFQHDHTAPIPGRAIGYIRRSETWRIANSLLDVVGDGGMYSTVDDMLRWATAFERPEFAPLLSRMQTPGYAGRRACDRQRLRDGVIAECLSRPADRLAWWRARRLPDPSPAFARREVDRRDVVQQCDGKSGAARGRWWPSSTRLPACRPPRRSPRARRPRLRRGIPSRVSSVRR